MSIRGSWRFSRRAAGVRWVFRCVSRSDTGMEYPKVEVNISRRRDEIAGMSFGVAGWMVRGVLVTGGEDNWVIIDFGSIWEYLACVDWQDNKV